MQVDHHRQIQPALSCPDVSDITRPLHVRLVGMEVPAQPVRCNVEVVIAVGGRVRLWARTNGAFKGSLFAGSDNANTVVTHQTAHTAMPNHRANLFQLLSHSWAAIAAQTQMMLFADMGQQHHVVTMALTDWTVTPSPEATRCDL